MSKGPIPAMRKCISIRLKLRRLMVRTRAAKSVTVKNGARKFRTSSMTRASEYGQLAQLLPNAIVGTHLRFVLIPWSASLPAQQQSTRRFVRRTDVAVAIYDYSVHRNPRLFPPPA